MKITSSSVFSSIIISSLIILIIYLIINFSKMIKDISFYAIAICIGAIVIRLILPIEFFHMITLPSTRLLPKISQTNSRIAVLGFELYAILLFLWFSVAVYLIIYNIFQYFKLMKSVKNISCSNDPYLLDIIRDIIEEKGGKRKRCEIRIGKSPILSTPMIVGIRNPIIIIPDLDFTDSEIYFILKHEIEHYYSYHLFLKLLLVLLNCIYWWNPAIYFFKKSMNNYMEICIDRSISEKSTEMQKLDYAECILKVAKAQAVSCNKFVLPFFNKSDSSTKRRLTILLSSKPGLSQRALLSFITPLVVSTLIFISCFLIFEPYSVPTDILEESFEINEDEYYLIQTEDGYALYNNDDYIATINDIDEPFTGLPIYNTLEEGGDLR